MLGLADDLIVEAIGKCESDDLNPKLAFQGLLAAINFVMRSSGVILPPLGACLRSWCDTV
jgi:hypothetical protein